VRATSAATRASSLSVRGLGGLSQPLGAFSELALGSRGVGTLKITGY
jgi:hypothetical protein